MRQIHPFQDRFCIFPEILFNRFNIAIVLSDFLLIISGVVQNDKLAFTRIYFYIAVLEQFFYKAIDFFVDVYTPVLQTITMLQYSIQQYAR